ncbi:MAG: hypothetical protein ACC628_15685 [Pirellulaceae bacterium]
MNQNGAKYVRNLVLDPDESYLQMYRAMRDGDLDEARALALKLKQWLDGGGAYPLFYAEEEVRAYLSSVFR